MENKKHKEKQIERVSARILLLISCNSKNLLISFDKRFKLLYKPLSVELEKKE